MYLQHPKYKIDYSKFQIQHPKYKIDYSKFQIQFPKYQMDYLEYHIQNSQERARLLGLSQRALNEGNTNAVVFVTGDQVMIVIFEDMYYPTPQQLMMLLIDVM